MSYECSRVSFLSRTTVFVVWLLSSRPFLGLARLTWVWLFSVWKTSKEKNFAKMSFDRFDFFDFLRSFWLCNFSCSARLWFSFCDTLIFVRIYLGSPENALFLGLFVAYYRLARTCRVLKILFNFYSFNLWLWHTFCHRCVLLGFDL